MTMMLTSILLAMNFIHAHDVPSHMITSEFNEQAFSEEFFSVIYQDSVADWFQSVKTSSHFPEKMQWLQENVSILPLKGVRAHNNLILIENALSQSILNNNLTN